MRFRQFYLNKCRFDLIETIYGLLFLSYIVSRLLASTLARRSIAFAVVHIPFLCCNFVIYMGEFFHISYFIVQSMNNMEQYRLILKAMETTPKIDLAWLIGSISCLLHSMPSDCSNKHYLPNFELTQRHCHILTIGQRMPFNASKYLYD